MKLRIRWTIYLLLFFWVLGNHAVQAHAGVGTQQINNVNMGAYRIWVWSDPEPPVMGEYHVAVALTESLENDPNGLAGEPVLNADVLVEMEHSRSGQLLISQATHEDAVNQLFYEAEFAPEQLGLWTVRVIVQGPDGPVQVEYTDEIVPPVFPWMAVGGGLLALLLAGAGVALYLYTGKDAAAQTAGSREKRGEKKAASETQTASPAQVAQ